MQGLALNTRRLNFLHRDVSQQGNRYEKRNALVSDEFASMKTNIEEYFHKADNFGQDVWAPFCPNARLSDNGSTSLHCNRGAIISPSGSRASPFNQSKVAFLDRLSLQLLV